ncbi:MAG: hypothetical protein JRF54_10700, partial [Deltaproteobacteria bacterium]|nr:hypothetical protein [Deltaproteobacteria bacterium]
IVIDISSPPPRVLDSVKIPGRGNKMREVAGTKGRIAVFRDTSGGAYSYLASNGTVYVPGANDTILRIPIRNRRVVRDEMVYLNLGIAVGKGTIVEDILNKNRRTISSRRSCLLPTAGFGSPRSTAWSA